MHHLKGLQRRVFSSVGTFIDHVVFCARSDSHTLEVLTLWLTFILKMLRSKAGLLITIYTLVIRTQTIIETQTQDRCDHIMFHNSPLSYWDELNLHVNLQIIKPNQLRSERARNKMNTLWKKIAQHLFGFWLFIDSRTKPCRKPSWWGRFSRICAPL